MLEVRREVVLSWRSRVHRGLVIRVAIVLEIRIFIRVLIFVLDLVLGLLIQVQELQPINFFFLLFFFHGAAAAKYQLKDNKHTTDFTQDLGT